MSETKHGPVRALVEQAIDAQDAIDNSPIGEEVGASEFELEVIRFAASAHDARVAQLVAAAEAFITVLDDERGFDPYAAAERKAQLRAALEGMSTKEGGSE